MIATDSSIPPTIGRRAFGAAGTLPAPRRQTKHHDWEEARHEHARGAVACVEAVDITVEYRAGRVGELTNLEPGDGVQYLMQTGWDQQTVNETEDARTHCARRHDPLATRMDSMLHRWPNVAKDGGEDQTEKARRNRHKTFTAEEAQEVRKFDTCPTVVHGATHRASNDTCQHTHVDFRIDGYHRFREDEVTDSPCQCRGTRAVF